jgi:hypothetical protein
MKIEVEIPENWIIDQLKEDIETCLSTSLPDDLPIRPHHIANLVSAIETCNAMNKIIQYYGGETVDLLSIKPWKSEELSAEDREILKNF